MGHILAPLRRYADFSGRSRRTEFWSWLIFFWVMIFILMFLDATLGLGGSATSYSNSSGVGFNVNGGWLTLLFALAALVPNLAVSVRRLHDTGKSGWTLLIGLVPLIGIIILIVFWVADSEPGDNAFGPNPKAIMA